MYIPPCLSVSPVISSHPAALLFLIAFTAVAVSSLVISPRSTTSGGALGSLVKSKVDGSSD